MIVNGKMMASSHQKWREIDMKSRLAENIKTFRKERKMTQEQLAEAIVYLGKAFAQSLDDLDAIMMGYANVFSET